MTLETETVTEQETDGAFSAEGNQYLTFMLDDGDYGIEILRVQEIKGYTGVTRIPNTPPFIKGVLNLRGTIVPIIDLRIKFGMAHKEYCKTTVIIIVEVSGRTMGIIVDAVSDVMNIPEKEIQALPEFGEEADLGFINGIGKCGNKLVSLLDIDQILSPEEEGQVSVAAGTDE